MDSTITVQDQNCLIKYLIVDRLGQSLKCLGTLNQQARTSTHVQIRSSRLQIMKINNKDTQSFHIWPVEENTESRTQKYTKEDTEF